MAISAMSASPVSTTRRPGTLTGAPMPAQAGPPTTSATISMGEPQRSSMAERASEKSSISLAPRSTACAMEPARPRELHVSGDLLDLADALHHPGWNQWTRSRRRSRHGHGSPPRATRWRRGPPWRADSTTLRRRQSPSRPRDSRGARNRRRCNHGVRTAAPRASRGSPSTRGRTATRRAPRQNGAREHSGHPRRMK